MFRKKSGLESFLINKKRNNNSNFGTENLMYLLSTKYLLQVAGCRVKTPCTLNHALYTFRKF
jgi:hypothetical protein